MLLILMVNIRVFDQCSFQKLILKAETCTMMRWPSADCRKLVSLSTGFLTFCLFNVTVFMLSFIGTLLDSVPAVGPNFSWQVAMAVTPTIWIARNKNMKEKIKTVAGCCLPAGHE